MPSELVARREIEVDADAAWAVLADFVRTDVWNPEVPRSHGTSGIDRGLGARRRCIFDARGKKWTEELITAFDDVGRSFTLKIVDGPAKPPVDDVRVTMAVRPLGPGRCEVTAHAVLTGSSFPQRLAARAGAKVLKGVFARVLAGLDHHLRTGEPVPDRGVLKRAGVELRRS